MGNALPAEGCGCSALMLVTMAELQLPGMTTMGIEVPGQGDLGGPPGKLPGMPGPICMAMKSPLTAMGGGGIIPTGGIMPGGICESPICRQETRQPHLVCCRLNILWYVRASIQSMGHKPKLIVTQSAPLGGANIPSACASAA